MIYLVTALPRPDLNPKKIQVITVERSLELLEPLRKVSTDTETTGLDCWTKVLKSVQLGNQDFQVVIDCGTVNILRYKEYLESDRTFLFWNGKFDLKFFYRVGIIIRNIQDGFLHEQLLWLGYPRGSHSMSLASAALTYINYKMNKEVRGKIIWAGMEEDVIIYGATDVKYLEPILDAQEIELKKQDLIVAAKWEDKFCPVVAYFEYCGIRLDVPKWTAKTVQDQKDYDNAKNTLDKWVIDNLPGSEWVEINNQGDLFSGFNLEPNCTINWSSSKQVGKLLKRLGYNIETQNKKGEPAESIDIKILIPQKGISTILEPYIAYSKAAKIVSTYGQTVLKQVHEDTGRLYTQFNQLGADTTRLSSGGKDKENGIDYINFQNFPADELTRSCFIAEEGNVWISCDYASQESRIIADLSNDKAMIDLFNHGCGDVHSLTAKMSYPKEIGDTPIEDIKKKFHTLRGKAKSIEFAISYGGNANTIMNNMGISLEESQKIYDDYMNGFKGVKTYQETQRKFVMEHGYVLLNDRTGHRAHIYDYDKLIKIKNRLTYSFYADAKEYKNQERKYIPEAVINQITDKFAEGVPIDQIPGTYVYKDKAKNQKIESIGIAEAYRYPIKYYFKRKSESEKQAIDYKCQGTGAQMFRLACIYFWDYILKNNLFNIIKCCIPAHDRHFVVYKQC